jgi:hypothetical protein
MSIVINGSGTISGISVGGLPDSIVDAGTLATDSVDSAELIDGSIDTAHLASGVGGKVLQVLQAERSAELDLASDSWVTLTGLYKAITPASTSSKFLVTVHLCGVGKHSSLVQGHLRLQQSVSGGADTDITFSRSSASLVSVSTDSHYGTTEGISYLWSPNTTSTVTYYAQTKRHSGVGTYRINANTGTNDVKSTITVMEIGG